MDTIEYVYFKKMRPGTIKSDNSHITLTNSESTGYRIPLNKALTDMVMTKGCHYVSFASNKLTGQKFLVFNHDYENGLEFRYPKEGAKFKCISIYSKNMHQFLRNSLGMKKNENRIWVSDDLSKNNDSVVIEIKRD